MIYRHFLINLAATLLVEGVIVALWFRRRDYVYYNALCNLLTNPALNLLLPGIVRLAGAEYYTAVLIALEILVVLIEAWVMRLLCGFRPAKALFVSGVINAGSLLSGLLIHGQILA